MLCRHLGTVDFESTFDAMKAFTASRTPDTEDEIWLLQHLPVYTQGLSGKPEHVLDPGDVPIIQIDRGGQVTYHGPGQLTVYPILDLRGYRQDIHWYMRALEETVILALRRSGIENVRNETINPHVIFVCVCV